MQDAAHPIWSLVRLTILMGTLVLVLWLQASSFDRDEIVTLVTAFVAAASSEGVINKVTGVSGK